MISLSGKLKGLFDLPFEEDKVFRISTNQLRPKSLKSTEVFLSKDGDMPEGFALILALASSEDPIDQKGVFNLTNEYDYIRDGDIIKISPNSKKFRILYRSKSKFNSFLITERCNHLCLMCSQPPKDIDDGILYDETIEVLKLCDREPGEICFSGGEPTTEIEKFIKLLKIANSFLPEKSVHVLSNGRSCVNKEFVSSIAEINHPDLMFGIPLYSSDSYIHDHIVQAHGAFNDTIKGIVNLNRNHIPVEIRVVLHALTIPTLEVLAYYISRSLPFVSQVAFMGLEITGFTRANLDELWVEPDEYQLELSKAVQILENVGIKAKIYNLPLCLTNPELWANTVKSISDWKNEYIPECQNCDVREKCGGFFSSATHKMPTNIKAVTNT